MRIANKTVFDAAKFHLATISQELNDANQVVASGKRITDLSDDPVRLTQTLNIKSVLVSVEQLENNISLGNSWLVVSESALMQTQDIVSDMKALSVQMATATTAPAQRFSAAQTVQNMLDEIISLANTEVSGRYIFAGTKTDTVAFSQDGTYNGNNNPFTVKIEKNATIAVGSDGSAVFGALLTTLGSFKTALEANSVGGVKQAMTDLNTHFDALSSKISDVGSKMLRMEIKENILQELNLSSAERLSKIEDADIAEAIMNLKSIEFAYQAALSSSARIMTMSLMDYLK